MQANKVFARGECEITLYSSLRPRPVSIAQTQIDTLTDRSHPSKLRTA